MDSKVEMFYSMPDDFGNNQMWIIESPDPDLNGTEVNALPSLVEVQEPLTPFTEVSIKYERFLSCTDCGRNFVSKQKFNSHLEECGTSEDYQVFPEVMAYPPRRPKVTPATTPVTADGNVNPVATPTTSATASTLVKNEKKAASAAIPDPEISLSNDNENEDSSTSRASGSVTYTCDPGLLQSSSSGSSSPSYSTPTFEGFLVSRGNFEKSISSPIPASYVGSNGKVVEPLQCHICHKVYNTKYGYKLHLRTHTGNKGYTCDLCGKSFSQSGHLKDHRRIHTGEKPFSCDICGKKFAQNQNLKHHLRMHTGIGPFRCNLCDKSFFTKREFESHQRVHTGERLTPAEALVLTPYPCDICGATFKRKGSLNQHVKFHFVSPHDRGNISVQ